MLLLRAKNIDQRVRAKAVLIVDIKGIEVVLIQGMQPRVVLLVCLSLYFPAYKLPPSTDHRLSKKGSTATTKHKGVVAM